MIPAGTVLDDKYTIVAPIGGGGFGYVYLAEHNALGRKCAIKALHSTLKLAPDAVPRFEREAKVLHSLQHKNIVGFYGYGVCPDGAPYMVMEFVEGKSLWDMLIDGQPLEFSTAQSIARQVFEALACAHASGIVHRDLKPHNIIIDSGGTAKIIDFGLAKLLPQNDVTLQRLTETGFTVGTFQYAAPEQAFGANIDGRADIYSGGCIVYHMISGRPPFDGEDPMTLMQQHLRETPRNLAAAGLDVGAARLGVFAANCMAKSPDERYSTAAEALADLDAVGAGRSIEKRALAITALGPPARKSVGLRIVATTVAAVVIFALGIKLYQDAAAAKAQRAVLQAKTDGELLEHVAHAALGEEQFEKKLLEIEKRQESDPGKMTEYQRFLLNVQLLNIYTTKLRVTPRSMNRGVYEDLAHHYAMDSWMEAQKHPDDEKYWNFVEIIDANVGALYDPKLNEIIENAMLRSSIRNVRQTGRCSVIARLWHAGQYDQAKKMAAEGLGEPGGTQSERQYLVEISTAKRP